MCYATVYGNDSGGSGLDGCYSAIISRSQMSVTHDYTSTNNNNYVCWLAFGYWNDNAEPKHSICPIIDRLDDGFDTEEVRDNRLCNLRQDQTWNHFDITVEHIGELARTCVKQNVG